MKYVQLYVDVDETGLMKSMLSGERIVPDASYHYYFYMPEEEVNELGRARVTIGPDMKPVITKEAE